MVGEAVVGCLIEPVGFLWLGPPDDVVFLAEPFPSGKVDRAVLVQSCHELNFAIPQQCEHQPAAVEAVGQDQIATGQFVAALQLLEQRAEERAVSPVSLPLYGPVANATAIPVASDVGATARRIGKPSPLA